MNLYSECLTFELRRDRRYCAATIKSCTSHRRGAMPLGLASSEGLGLDFRRALRLTDWLAGWLKGLEHFCLGLEWAAWTQTGEGIVFILAAEARSSK